ncbi:MAG: D-glycerate dehydrogenase [Cyclobacteriaceae bacterium]|nr:D-glycerate dehydrogenase [Cyclobacteriaceae bacterium]
MSKKVLVTRIIPGIAEDMLKQAGFDVTVWQGDRAMTKDELTQYARQANILLSLGSNKLDRSFFETCKHLEIVSQFAVGFDNIDVAAATDYKIPVCNTPDVLSEATADVAFALMINVSRKMFYHHKLIQKGEWKQFEPLKNLGFELTGKTLGIFGLGRIGSIMAQRCKGAYGMKVIYHNRTRNPKAETELGAQYVDFNTLLRDSDILSVHSALTDETKGLFNKQAFAKMKTTAVFINTSRGAVHNEADLIEALQNGTIWGAGLDVTNPEPMQATNPLLEMSSVAVLPHIGSATVEARTGMARLAAENIISYYQTGKPVTIVNPTVLIP